MDLFTSHLIILPFHIYKCQCFYLPLFLSCYTFKATSLFCSIKKSMCNFSLYFLNHIHMILGFRFRIVCIAIIKYFPLPPLCYEVHFFKCFSLPTPLTMKLHNTPPSFISEATREIRLVSLSISFL